jgi:hypothetical protein
MATKKNVTTKKAAAPERTKVNEARDQKSKAKKPAKAESAALTIHINKTGRVCLGKTAAARIGDPGHMLMTIDGKQVRMVAKAAATDNTIEIRRANGRPYVSATRFLKPLGFDGSKALDIQAAAYNSHGFEFKIA